MMLLEGHSYHGPLLALLFPTSLTQIDRYIVHDKYSCRSDAKSRKVVAGNRQLPFKCTPREFHT
jgi:hypothetical protein